MQIQGKVAVVTGGAQGIGRALCRKFAEQGARAVVVADVDRQAGVQLSQEINGFFVPCNASKETDVQMLAEAVMAQAGRIDVFCSGACMSLGGALEASNKQWRESWETNLMAHVYAVRAVLPQWLERKEGYWLQVVEAAEGRGSAPDAAGRFGGLGFAWWLGATYHAQGIRVSVFSAKGVATNLLRELESMKEETIEPDEVAAHVMEAMASEKFLVGQQPKTRARASGRR